MDYIFLKLRGNIELEGDLGIVEKEVNYFCKKNTIISQSNLIEVTSKLDIHKKQIISNSRKTGAIGYLIEVKNYNVISSIILKSSFIQEIWCKPSLIDKKTLKKPYVEVLTDTLCCIVPVFALLETMTYLKSENPSVDQISAFTRNLAGIEVSKKITSAINRCSTSTPHVHGLHKYKAKFFPRLIRTLLLTEAEGKEQVKVLDPFVGSGTSLIESSFLGFDSIGIDIDKLSCLITESKIKLMKISPLIIEKEAKEFACEPKKIKPYEFPSWISKKFERNGIVNEMQGYQAEISSFVSRTATLNGSKDLFQTIISDALNRKFNIRMMGTGVPRFALEIQKKSISNLIRDNAEFLLRTSNLIKSISEVYELELKQPTVINGSAVSTGLEDSSIDIIITSPPYLPASSGREDYLIGKSISITALGLLTESEIRNTELTSVGSMKNRETISGNDLPNSVYNLYEWLKNDELRNIKAEPTLAYYRDIKKSLKESFRVLNKTGKAIYVIGKESTFYSYKSREVLYKVECDKIFEEISLEIGFKIKEKFDVELNKKNKNARPRSLDKYYESVFILKK
jgi:DNA modification methylase